MTPWRTALSARRFTQADALYKALEGKLEKSDSGLFWFYWSQTALGLRFGRRKDFPLLLFAQELLALLRSGISILEAIEALREKELRPSVRGVLDGIHDALRQGKTLSSALEEYAATFPALFIAAIRARMSLKLAFSPPRT